MDTDTCKLDLDVSLIVPHTMVFSAKKSHKIRDIKYKISGPFHLSSSCGLLSDRLIFLFREMDKAV